MIEELKALRVQTMEVDTEYQQKKGAHEKVSGMTLRSESDTAQTSPPKGCEDRFPFFFLQPVSLAQYHVVY